jgi:hypothetical protein
MLGPAVILNDAVFVAETLVLQPSEFCIAVMVTVFAPTVLSTDVVNVPLLAPMVSVAVAAVTVLTPVTL